MNIYTAQEIKSGDRKAEKQGLSPFTLMENAGRNIAEKVMSYTDEHAHTLILAGRGNNGGDGIVVARYLKEAGYGVTLHFPLGNPKMETAQAHLNFYKACGFDVSDEFHTNQEPSIIVDALLGVGSTPPLRHNAANIIHWANEQPAHRYAIDIPTGVDADYGSVETVDSEGNVVVFQGDVTFALHGAKPSAFMLPASRFYGKVIPVPIGLKQESNVRLTIESDVRSSLPERNKSGHKGTFGTSLLFAGSDDMPGSALLAAIGAIRSGTGKLILGTTRFAASVITPRIPEATYMPNGLKAISEKKNLPPKVSAIGIGPGLDDAYAIQKALDQLMQTDIPLVIDAGALLEKFDWKRKAPTVLTPHPGEFSKMMRLSTKDIQANRINVARDYAKENDVILVLKGHYTVIAFPDGHVIVNPTGNVGLAKGGSGDVLTGMITSLMSYYESVHAAVMNAVYLHGLCADLWSETESETTMTASDFDMLLPKAFQMIE